MVRLYAMMITDFPPELERLIVQRTLGEEAARQFEQGLLPNRVLAPLARAVAELSARFTTERNLLPAKYTDSKAARAAYLLYFLPANFPKTALLLDELAAHPDSLLQKEHIRILDLGSGVGTATVSALNYLARKTQVRSIEAVAVDSSAEALAECRSLATEFAQLLEDESPNLSFKLATIVKSLKVDSLDGINGSFDIIIASNLLNELFSGQEGSLRDRARFIKSVAQKFLAADGSILIIEPSLRSTTRELQMVRDLVVAESELNIYSPCLFDDLCPMLREGTERDWCHSAYPWHRPQTIKQIDQMIGNRKESLKFAYMIFRRDGKQLRDAVSNLPGSLWRAVGDMQTEKGRSFIYLCGEGSYRRHTLLKRDRTPENRAFEDIERGDIASISGYIEKEKETRIGRETTVTKAKE